VADSAGDHLAAFLASLSSGGGRVWQPEKRPPKDPLTLEDIAVLADETDLPVDAVRRVGEFARTHPLFTERIASLRALAEEAGVERLWDALLLSKEFESLLQAETWEHPAEILDPDGNLGIPYRELVHIAKARAARAEDPSVFTVIRQKLEKAREAQRAAAAPVHSIVAQLLNHEPGKAEKLLHQAILEYQRQRQEPEE